VAGPPVTVRAGRPHEAGAAARLAGAAGLPTGPGHHLVVALGPAGAVVGAAVTGHERAAPTAAGLADPPPDPGPTTTPVPDDDARPAPAVGGPRRAATRGGWTPAAAAVAAGQRWDDRHPSVATLTHLVVAPDAPDGTAEALIEGARADAGSRGARRLDVRTPAGGAVASFLSGLGWFGGRLGADAVLSCPVTPHTVPAPRSRLPRPAARTIRRIRALHPMMAPELARTWAEEARELARRRHLPDRQPERPPGGLPEGAGVYAPTRYRTIRRALAVVPRELQATTLLDVGCGAGRVLDVAAREGFTDVFGIDVDPEQIARTRHRIGARGRIELVDATTRAVPASVGVVFINNPFGPDLIARFCDRLRESLRASPRPLVVIYVNAIGIDHFRAIGLEQVHLTPWFAVLATPPVPAP
jgi:hypothetical protein